MRKLLSMLSVIIFVCISYGQPANDNTTVGLWQMGGIAYLASGQPIVPDDDSGTHYFNTRACHMYLGGSATQWTSNQADTLSRAASLVSEGRPGGNGYSLLYDGVNDWSTALNVWNGLDFKYDALEVEFWFKPIALPSGTSVVYVIGATIWEIRLRGDGQLQYMTRDAADAARWCLTDAGRIVANKWYYVKIYFENGTQTLSVKSEDDTEAYVKTTTDLAPMKYLNSGLYLGGSPSRTSNVNMMISEVKVSVPNMPGPQDWQSPYSDNIDTLALLHFDELMDSNSLADPTWVYTPDDNSFNPRRRAFNSKLFDFDSTPILVDSFAPEFGKCIEFDGVNDRVLVANMSKYDYVAKETFRVESWVKLGDDAIDAETGQEYSIASQLYTFRYHYLYEDSQWKVFGIFGYEISGTFYGVTLKAPVDTPRQWHHIALQWHRGLMSLYIDGELKDRRFNRSVQVLRPSSTRLAIGSKDSAAESFKFVGLIDEVRFISTVSNQVPCAQGTTGYAAGDVNRDCAVDIFDYAKMADQWLDAINMEVVYDWSSLAGDLNYDTLVNSTDLSILAEDWLSVR